MDGCILKIFILTIFVWNGKSQIFCLYWFIKNWLLSFAPAGIVSNLILKLKAVEKWEKIHCNNGGNIYGRCKVVHTYVHIRQFSLDT